ncbi:MULTISPECIES: hypothetical protein [Rhodococcus]|uniref:PAS domain-containing protein n=1 Tax=Rhodococcus baikonurensis TaxID=172041 RepID=A0ABV5XM73_9NOCA|nr:hypothetical protein [Rhodococcus sp. IEGM 1318]MDV8007759.1 hypothetical protein [Rhodococcus sp. IEGM 1318]
MTSSAPRWVSEVPPQQPTIIQHWDGMPSITLSRIATGARLLWMFHEDFPDQLGVFIHLTDDEAQKVFETPNDHGLIEGIRSNLRDRNAYVWRKDDKRFGARPFRIPKRGDEPSFSESMWDAAEAVDLEVRIGTPYEAVRPTQGLTNFVVDLMITRTETLEHATTSV